MKDSLNPRLLQFLLLMDPNKKVYPMRLKPETREDIDRIIVSLRLMLAMREAESERIIGRIMTLLGHYWVGKENELAGAAKFLDWYEALKGFPYWAINEACKQHLESDIKRPTIVGIRMLTISAMAGPQRMHDRLVIVSSDPDKEVKETGKFWRDMTKKERDEQDEMTKKIKADGIRKNSLKDAEGCKP